MGLSWREIAGKLGNGSPVFYTAALLGHQALTPEEAAKAGNLLNLEEAESAILAEIPENRGASAEMPPSDPLIYRFYEIVQGYGPTLKALINEEFGDGIMSAIDFTMEIEREPDSKGDRVKVTMSDPVDPHSLPELVQCRQWQNPSRFPLPRRPSQPETPGRGIPPLCASLMG